MNSIINTCYCMILHILLFNFKSNSIWMQNYSIKHYLNSCWRMGLSYKIVWPAVYSILRNPTMVLILRSDTSRLFFEHPSRTISSTKNKKYIYCNHHSSAWLTRVCHYRLPFRSEPIRTTIFSETRHGHWRFFFIWTVAIWNYFPLFLIVRQTDRSSCLIPPTASFRTLKINKLFYNNTVVIWSIRLIFKVDWTEFVAFSSKIKVKILNT